MNIDPAATAAAPSPAVRDHRNRHRVRDATHQVKVVAAHLTFAGHVRDDQLARPQLTGLPSPFGGFEVEGPSPAAREGAEPLLVVDADVDGADHGLPAVVLRGRRDGVLRVEQTGTEDDLLDSRGEDVAHLGVGLDAAAVGEGHEGLGGDVLDLGGSHHRLSTPGGDVDDHQLVDALVVEDLDRVDRIADVGRPPVSPGLHDEAVQQLHRGYHSCSHARHPANSVSTAMPKRWDFSGWNCIPTTESRPTTALKPTP